MDSDPGHNYIFIAQLIKGTINQSTINQGTINLEEEQSRRIFRSCDQVLNLFNPNSAGLLNVA